MVELGIVDTRNIISVIAQKYNYDFSDYALTSFKRRLESFIDQHSIKYPDLVVNKLLEDKTFGENLIEHLQVPSTEMFRDPSLWRMLREEIIIGLYRESSSSFKIWLPNSVSGDELFTLAILLKEMDMLGKVQICASCLTDRSIELIKSGVFESSKLEISDDNYTRANGHSSLSNYYKTNNGQSIRDISLIKDVTFFRQNTFLDPAPQGIKLILFRNKMIYYNQTLQSRIIKTLNNSSVIGGILVTGTKESLNTVFGGNEFTLTSISESVYKRRA
jgi:chemotaxis protein methyltransferase CheR